MPQLGESVVEGTVSRWLKQEGDAVQAYEPLLEISTDKVETEIPAPAAGVLVQIVVAEGQTVGKGTLLGVIGEAMPVTLQPLTPDPSPTQAGRGEKERESVGARLASPAANITDTPSPTHENGHAPFVTPVVAWMAAEYSIDLSRIQGSGRGGRVTRKDVEGYLRQPLTPDPSPSGRGEKDTFVGARLASPAENPSSATRIAEPQPDHADNLPPWERPGSGDLFKPSVEYGEKPLTPNPSPTQAGRGEQDTFVGARLASPAEISVSTSPTHPDTSAARLHPIESIPQVADDELIPISPMRRSIAEHMTRSVKTSPHVTTVFEMDLSAVVAHREAHKAEFAAQGVNLTFTAYFAAVAIEALRAVPVMNATWMDDAIRQFRTVHLGIAVSVADGLIVPVIRNAGDLNLLGLARAVNDMANRARNKAIKPDETQNGTFTITNHGVGGSLFATPIINQPQTGIMGVGVIEKRVKVITDERGNDMLAIRPCCYVSLTFDHRTADGALGDAFLLVVKRRLEGWEG
jgi:2-oxoglutarate dehydrogenase E2 component (dihydrolipoamide succinyltransferase)